MSKSISRNEFYYFVDCFFRGLSKALISANVSMSFDQSFSESYMCQTSFDQQMCPQLEEPRGEFYRMITNGTDGTRSNF